MTDTAHASVTTNAAEGQLPLDTPIESLELTVGTYNALKWANVHIVRELVALTRDELSERFSGRVQSRSQRERALDEIVAKLAQFSLHLAA